ncbi:hypothetical protein IFT48_04320 [Pseudomonas fluorescens]|uniref:hypothetical protein n=1 Tax=Pseudomonas TaxID=286 RepID=UPI0013CE9B7A|nr:MULTISPECIES: hypothetical protein [Pseudomonas]MBD8089197.1 hypothetical protein [Pseudomonas fluorescens]MBD8615376.1 hypothetical protein [Pseudomonas putida]MBD8681970.1 hypothetical protein [Pseudomonas sp. CFBP 13719]
MKKKAKHKGGKSGLSQAKSMVQIPLYRSRVAKTAQDQARKRPSKNTLMKAIDNGGLCR